MASSSQAVTLQVEALSAVHTAIADDEKRGLKRKLAASEQELAKTRQELADTKKMLRVERATWGGETGELLRISDLGMGYLSGLYQRISPAWPDQTRLHLSHTEVGRLYSIWSNAHHCFRSVKHILGQPDTEDEDEDEDDEDDDEDEQ